MDKMELVRFILEKMNKNPNKVVVTYYELKVKRNMENTELFGVVHLISEELEKIGFKTYRTGQKYVFNNEENIVESNELLIGIR